MPRITEIWAYVIADSGPEDEGVPAMRIGNDWLPMVGADGARMISLKDYARGLAQREQKPIRLLRFTGREEMEVIEP